ncbi:polyprenyl synthetase family protein [Oricola cellulosilytica]|uniref:Probable farnesyl diphosphate synthase n=1 Tax=Oricola cellulosilytica TaxID=1429082 RepID=A0A4V2MP21_9HYPH|nr:farnesyl diphosphate synthase [Oricola cellulosilytica]TCD15972.1 polyprenyl synthetase family protein [Oricola cellulosilytica]
MRADEFSTYLSGRASEVDAFLSSRLGEKTLPGERVRPPRLLAAIRHGVLNGGKRFRPFLLLETAKLFDADDDGALYAAAALECVHCYSLIHDDLPAMDDDDMRRGAPTVHRAFDEASAILAGDSLLTLAFDLVTDEASGFDGETRAALANRLARAAGLGGMAGGQALDLQASTSRLDEAGVMTLQAMKTGALIRFACEAGGVIGGATDSQLDRLCIYGEKVGLAFQLADDLLDMTQSASVMGKATGKDAAQGKATLASLNGEDWARRKLDEFVSEAEDLAKSFGEAGSSLAGAARFVASRRL